MGDGALAWLATLGRAYLGASGLAVVLLVRGVPDFPLEAPGFLGTVLLLAGPAVAVFGALWRAPARWAFFVGPLVVLAAAFALARAALVAPGAFGLPVVPTPTADRLLVPLLLVMVPGALVGAAGAAASLDR